MKKNLYLHSLRALVAVMAALFAMASANAEVINDVIIDGLYYNLDTDAYTAEVGYQDVYNETLANLTLPETVEYGGHSYTLTSISRSAFYGSFTLKSLSMPDCITEIGDMAFCNCAYLETIKISSAVKEIKYYTFCNDYALTSFTVGEGITKIGENAFSGCMNLSSINLPASLTEIGKNCFYDCQSLTTVTIPENVSIIGEAPFWKCVALEEINTNENNNYFVSVDGVLYNADKSKLIAYPCNKAGSEYAVLPQTSTVGEYSFTDSKNIAQIILPENLESIGNSAFSGCENLASINFPNTLKSIDRAAFQNCSSLTDIKIPFGIASINDNTFNGCINLTNISIPNSVEYIGNYSFYDCTSLTEITIPEKVSTLGCASFASSNSLTKVHVNAVTPPTITSDWSWSGSAFSQLTELTGTLYVPVGSEKAYKQAAYWQNFKNIIEEDPQQSGISNVLTDKNTSNSIYSIHGVKLKSTDSPGVYIINGKKTIIK